MNETTRERSLWIIALLAAAVVVASIVVYAVEGAFEDAWFKASLVTLAILIAGTLLIAITEPEPEPGELPSEVRKRARRAKQARRSTGTTETS